MEFAIVKAGHDKGKIYLIEKMEEEVAYLVNGTTRTSLNPRKKNRKHIQIIRNLPEEVAHIMEEKVPKDQRAAKAIQVLNAHIYGNKPGE